MITERVGEVAYQLELPPELSKVHNVFHVSMLRHYVSDLSHVIPPQPLEINPDLTYDEEPVILLDWKDNELWNKTVLLVNVLWRNHSMEEATWETEDRMREMYACFMIINGCIDCETYPDDERIHWRLEGYDSLTYQ
ncbi:uncharacterized protein [Malus domestica]|uniref:uncharacterized protein n=1 Tax=Malus domestica TaxID=3750 RepID=UPI0039749D73